MTERVVGGLDGCRAGWVLATVAADDDAHAAVLDVSVVADLETVRTDLEAGRLVAAAIDIPIGLPSRVPRSCDREARRLLGPRRNSVFPAPVRSALAVGTYAQSCAVSRRACGRALSRQLYNILPKIREVDALQSSALQARLFEMHPELSFTVLAGGPMRFNKHTAAGRAERLSALGTAFGDLSPALGTPPAGAKPDDVLDAVVGAWTARRFVAQRHLRLGGALDRRGLRMEIIA